MNDPKTARNPKLGVIFAKCAPMTPYSPLAQTLFMGLELFSKENDNPVIA